MRDYENILTPPAIKLLPIDNKFNLPIMSVVPRSNGIGNFRFISDPRKIALAAYELCSICGQPLSGEFSTILAVDNDKHQGHTGHLPILETTEAPAHSECLVYASIVCPFLASGNSRYTEGDRKGLKKHEGVENPMVLVTTYKNCIPKILKDNNRPAIGFTYSTPNKSIILDQKIYIRTEQLKVLILESKDRTCLDARTFIIGLINNEKEDYSILLRKFSNHLGSGFIRGYDSIYNNGKVDRESAIYFRKKIDIIANSENKQIEDIGKFEEFEGLKSTAEWILSLNGVKTVCVESWWLDMDKRGLVVKKRSKSGNPAKHFI